MSEDWKRFELHTTQRGETTCIALLGEFDLLGLDQLEQELQQAEGRRGRAVLDLRTACCQLGPATSGRQTARSPS
jgi:hypothetical protein